MAERARAMLAALILVGCGDEGGGEEGGTTAAATTMAASGLTEETGVPAPTSGAADETGATSAATSGGGETGGDETTGGGDEETGTVEQPDGVFVAVGDGGRRVRSIDGEAWDGVVGSGLLDVEEEGAAPDALRALAVGDGYVLAVGGGGTYWAGNAMIMRSDDAGVSWQEDVLTGSPDVPQTKLHGVAASGQTAVAVGMRGKRIRSGDGGLTWTDVSFGDQNARFLAVAAVEQTFVVVGWAEDAYDAPKTSAITVSGDGGMTWSPVDEAFPRLDTVVVGGGVYLALGADVCLRGSDGVAWTDCGAGVPPFVGVSYTGGEFVLTSMAGLVTSPDGVKWTTPVMPELGAPKLVARGNNRWAGLRWTERGFAEAIETWTYTSYVTEPLRAIVFVPTP